MCHTRGGTANDVFDTLKVISPKRKEKHPAVFKPPPKQKHQNHYSLGLIIFQVVCKPPPPPKNLFTIITRQTTFANNASTVI